MGNQYTLVGIRYEVNQLPQPGVVGEVLSEDHGKTWSWVKTRGASGESSPKHKTADDAMQELIKVIKGLGEDHDY